MKSEWAYHITSSIYLDAIAEEGLTPSPQAGHGNRVFFAEEPVLDYGDTPLRFPWPDDAIERGWEWFSAKRVPPEEVQVFTGKEGREDVDEDWVPLIQALERGLA